MEINGVIHGAGSVVLHVDFDGVAQTHTEEWTRDCAVECPIREGGSICELTFHFDGFKVNADGGRFADFEGSGQVGWVADNICAGSGGLCGSGRGCG